MSFEAEKVLRTTQMRQLDAITGSVCQIRPVTVLLWLKLPSNVLRLYNIIQL